MTTQKTYEQWLEGQYEKAKIFLEKVRNKEVPFSLKKAETFVGLWEGRIKETKENRS